MRDPYIFWSIRRIRIAEDRLPTWNKKQIGQEWVALGERELLFQHTGVAVARGNSAILDTLRHKWSSGGTKRRQAKDPNKLWANDFFEGRFWNGMFSAEIAQAVRSGGF